MTELQRFTLPDVGEGLIEADILTWHVRPGDAVAINQPIVEVETAKAVVELPCPFEGTVIDLLVAEGTTVDVGTPLLTVAADPTEEPPHEDVPVLVGYGPATPVTRTRRPRRRSPAKAVPPTAGEERIPVTGVRKHMAAAMVRSAFTAPHVTSWLQVDVTETMQSLARLRQDPRFAGVRLSPLLPVAHALLRTVGRHPLINASWDEARREIVVKRHVNLGIAVATERGLIVPNVKDAHLQSLPELARSLVELTDRTRAHAATPADLTGGTITISNVGVFGVDAGTPILSPGEAAILALGQVRDLPWVNGGEMKIRSVATLALSFDHRIVDGELGSAVLRDVADLLEKAEQ